MNAPFPRYPAVLLVREQGEIVFANPAALEQVGRLAGDPPGEGWGLGDLLDRLYPHRPHAQRAIRVLDRALTLARRRGHLHCRVAVPQVDLGPTPWDVAITHLVGRSEPTYEVSFRPVPPSEARTTPGHRLLDTALHQAARILDRALAGAEPLEEDVLWAVQDLQRQVRALMDRLEGTPEGLLPSEPHLRGEG